MMEICLEVASKVGLTCLNILSVNHSMILCCDSGNVMIKGSLGKGAHLALLALVMCNIFMSNSQSSRDNRLPAKPFHGSFNKNIFILRDAYSILGYL
jgi:hypothetical protein